MAIITIAVVIIIIESAIYFNSIYGATYKREIFRITRSERLSIA